MAAFECSLRGDRLSFNVFTRNKGPNELQGVIDALWLYLETDYEYSTQARLLADFQRRIRDSSSAHPAIPRSLEPGDGHFVSAFAWDETNNPNYLQQPDLDALHAGTKICFVVVQVSYNDNGVTHHLRRCEWLKPPASHPGIWHFCQDFASD